MKKNNCIYWGVFSLLVFTCRVEACDPSLLLFGDSYFDTGAGNIVSAEVGSPLVSPTPPYFDGRHSDGLIWIDYTSAVLNLPVVNYAVAGAETGLYNVNTPPSSGFNNIGGLFPQLDRFESTGSRISSNQLVVVDGAGNNYLALIPADLNPAGIAAATTQALSDLGTVVLPTLQSLGAEKIVIWNLGDLSQLPIFNNPIYGPLDSPAVRALMKEASNQFNMGLIPVVQKLNAENVSDNKQIFIFDAYTAFNQISAELVAQGKDLTQFAIISNYGGPYIPTGADPNIIAFYDAVHPTTASWALFSRITSAFFDTLINAPRFAAAGVDLALETASAHRDLVDNHLRTLREEVYIYDYTCNDCSTFGCNRFQLYADAAGKWGSTSTRCGNLGLNYSTGLGTLGVDYLLSSNFIAGTSFTYQRSEARVKEGSGNIHLNDYIPTVYASFFGPCYFADIALSLHCYQFTHLKRDISFLDMTATGDTHGYAPELDVDIGYVGHRGHFTYMPLIGFSYEDITIERYHENGAGSLNMEIAGQYQKSFIGLLGGQLFYTLWNGCSLAFVEFFYEHEFLRDPYTMNVTFVNSLDNGIDFNDTSSVRRDMIEYALGFGTKRGRFLSNISYIGATDFENYSNGIRAQLDYVF